MSDEYISREAAIEAIEKHKNEMAKTGGVSNTGKAFYLIGQDHAIDVLRIVPTADVVPVVRCKDCVYVNGEGDFYWCKYYSMRVRDDFFCADMRKEKSYAKQ